MAKNRVVSSLEASVARKAGKKPDTPDDHKAAVKKFNDQQNSARKGTAIFDSLANGRWRMAQGGQAYESNYDRAYQQAIKEGPTRWPGADGFKTNFKKQQIVPTFLKPKANPLKVGKQPTRSPQQLGKKPMSYRNVQSA